jgi:hypothetical protein
MALRIPMAAWMTTLHMFFFCSFILFYFKGLNIKHYTLNINYVDFCHDSAKRASPMALAAPKVKHFSGVNAFPLCVAKVQHRKGGK